MRLYNFLNEAIHTKERAITKLFKDCKPYLDSIGVTTSEDFHENMPKFYRGENKKLSGLVKSNIPRRQPKGTKSDYFPFINQWLKKNGHVSRDQVIFAMPNKNYAAHFGTNVGIAFPIGPFTYTFVKNEMFNKGHFGSNWDSFALVWELRKQLCNNTNHVITADVQLTETTRKEMNDKVLLRYVQKNQVDALGEQIDVEVSSITVGGGTETDTAENWDKRASLVWQNFESNTNILEAASKGYEIWFNCKAYYVAQDGFLF